MATPLSVFVSSCWLDLEPERGAVRELTLRMSGLRFRGMEYFGSRDLDTTQTSLSEAEAGDVYVGIVGGRYGSGITEMEYQRARECGKPCFIYLKAEPAIEMRDDEPGAQAKRLAFVRRLREAHTCCVFETPHQLALLVSADLHNWLFERHVTRGLARLSVEYLARIQGFIAEYAGTAQRPVPFGGRDADLAALDAWLLEPAGAPYLLLTAGAGRGKPTSLRSTARPFR